MKLSDYVIDFLVRQGVKHVFMLPGGGAMHLNDSLGVRAAAGEIGFTPMLHEQAVGIAAEAYARTAEGLGAAMVTTGPGGTNTVTGVAAAWLDSTPVIFIAGQVKRPDIAHGTGMRQLGVQEIDLPEILKPITKYAATVMDPLDVRYHLEKAAHEALSGRPGPVWVEFPLDVQALQIDPDSLRGFEEKPTSAPFPELPFQVAEMIDLLNAAERPVLLLGNGIRVAGTSSQIDEVVRELGCPVLTTRLGVDLIPWDHPLCFGMPGSLASRGANFTLQNSDFLLVLGARLDMALIAYAPERLARGAKKVMVNIDPLEMTKLRGAINLPIEADIRDFIRELRRQKDRIKPKDLAPWVDRCRDWKARYPFVTDRQRSAEAGLSTYLVADTISELAVEGDIILPGSSGTACEIFLTAFKAKKDQRIFHNKGTGSMGLSQPSAIGACMVAGRRTIAVDGDGGFFMNVQELGTIRSLGLPIKMLVINNGGYASIRSSQKGYFGRMIAADEESGLRLPSVGDVSHGFSIPFTRIEQRSELRQGLRDFLDSKGPAVCEVIVPKDEPREPRITSKQRPDGSMVSSPLEDLFPFLDREEFKENMLIEPLEY